MDNILNNSQMLYGGILLGSIAVVIAFGKKILNGLWNLTIRKIVYSSRIEQTSFLFNLFEKWLDKNHSKQYNNVEPEILDNKLILKHGVDNFFIRYKGKILNVSKEKTKLEAASNLVVVYLHSFTISGLVARRQIEELLEEMVQEYRKEKATNAQAYMHYFVGDGFRFVASINAKNISQVVLKGKTEILKDLDSFCNNEKWYLERNIRYKRGYLFYGKPGNGKTSFAVALAKHLTRDLYVIGLNKMTDDKLKSAFLSIPRNCVLLLEDIDCAFDDRNSSNESEFSFSTLLNCIDGIFSASDVITIFTTNHIEVLDPALLRSGRIDYKMEITNPDSEHILKYLSLYFESPILKVDNIKEGLCMADVQNICIDSQNLEEALIKLQKIQ